MEYVTSSDNDQFSRVSKDGKEQKESPTDAVLIEEARLHVAIIQMKLYEILETNKRDAVKELGLIEHEGPDAVIALKTKQAIRNVIAKPLKNLTFLWSRGIIDKHEGIEMNKVLLTKIKALNNFPMAIPPLLLTNTFLITSFGWKIKMFSLSSSRKEPKLRILTTEMSSAEKVKCHKEST